MAKEEENFLSRWSRRKTQARSPTTDETARAQPPVPAPPPGPAPAERAPLPPVDSLTTESDFSPFMAPEVDGAVRTQALKTLFADPRFNVMDMMDVYVDDYSKPDPIPESWMGKLEQLSRLGDRAGRDREEAERQKALAEAKGVPAAESTDTPLVSPRTPETAEIAGAGDDGRSEVEVDAATPAIPSPRVGE